MGLKRKSTFQLFNMPPNPEDEVIDAAAAATEEKAAEDAVDGEAVAAEPEAKEAEAVEEKKEGSKRIKHQYDTITSQYKYYVSRLKSKEVGDVILTAIHTSNRRKTKTKSRFPLPKKPLYTSTKKASIV